jgi:hypothetical protein
MGENLHLHPHPIGVKPVEAPVPWIQLIAIPNDDKLNPSMKEVGWGKGKAEGPTTIKGEEGAEAGSHCGFRQRQRGDRRFGNEDDEEKQKLTWLLCMYREFV